MPDLCVLSDLKTRLKIPASNTNADAELQALITQASGDFHNACNRSSMFTVSYTEQRDGQGGRIMFLRNDPVQGVASLVVSGLSILQSPDGVQPGFAVDESTLKLVGYFFRPGYGNVQIQYSAGFGASLDDPDFPGEIELAVLDWCEYRYRVRPATGMTQKKLVTGETVAYDKRDMPETTKRVIEQYKRRVPAW